MSDSDPKAIQGVSQNKLRAAGFDLNANGYVTLEEVRKVIEKFGHDYKDTHDKLSDKAFQEFVQKRTEHHKKAQHL